jgi:hypothetical protein
MPIHCPIAFKITALRSRLGEFESHAKRLIGHTTLKTVHWANITQASLANKYWMHPSGQDF